jgi:Cu(I)/Ag(I) efflux system membrane fusion protein/cobalt-zinc-cadmium efflux system membrane fusion protein
MNKYVLRTSLVWLAVLVCVAAAYLYRSRKQHPAPSADIQPVAAGPAVSQEVPAVSQEGTQTSNASASSEAALSPVQLSPERLQSIGVETGTVEWKQVTDDIRATGTVDIDERLISYVQVRFSGYVRTVFANAMYQYVKKGEPLFTIYSPDLVATQSEYLLARRNESLLSSSSVDGVAAGATALTTAAEARLRQWNISDTDLAKLRETGQPVSDQAIEAPVSGYITERNALPNLYVEPATRLYAIADLSRIWVYAQVFQDDVGRLKASDPARITVDAYPERTFHGRIESILPQIDLATRTARVRVEISNPDLKLKPGMFVNVDLKTNAGRHLVVPSSAVLQSGTRQIAFVDEGGGRLIPKDVVIGPHVGDQVVILQGLSAGQRIVTSANFLIDSESQLQAAAGSYVPPPPGAGAVPTQPQASQVNIEFTTDPNPPRKGNNIFRVSLTGSDGKPIDAADVSVTFFMPAMPAMAMAAMTTTAKLASQGHGMYQGSGVLQSGGVWQVTITVQKNGQTLAAKQIRLSATGGM